MGVEEFNYKYIKDRASAGSWRRGYEYHLKDMVFDTYPEKNFYKGKVKGNFQEYYNTDLIFKKNKVEARCNCPLKEEWCKHAVAVGLKAIDEHAYEDWLETKFGMEFDYPDENTLTIYGSLNQSVEDNIDYTENIVEIEGGNHAQFGNYGPQKGDLPATISAEEQQKQTVEAIEDFLAQRGT